MGLIQDVSSKRAAEQAAIQEQALMEQQFKIDQLNQMRYLDARQEGYRQDQMYAPGLAGQQINKGFR